MASKRELREGDSIAADESEPVPAKKGRLEDDMESNLSSSDQSPEDSEEGEHQDMTSRQSNQYGSDVSVPNKEMVDNFEEGGGEDSNAEMVESSEEGEPTKSNQEENKTLEPIQLLLENDQFSHDSGSSDIQEFVGNCESIMGIAGNVDTNNETRSIVDSNLITGMIMDSNQETGYVDDSNQETTEILGSIQETTTIMDSDEEILLGYQTSQQVNSANSNREKIVGPLHGRTVKNYNSIDAAIDRVVAASCGESNRVVGEDKEGVIEISSDSEEHDVENRDRVKVADDSSRQSANRYIMISSRGSSVVSKSGIRKPLIKGKSASVASSVVSHGSLVFPATQSWVQSESISGPSPEVELVPNPSVARSVPPALLPMLLSTSRAPTLSPQCQDTSVQPFLLTPISKSASQSASPAQLDNAPNVNYFVVVTPPTSAPSNEKSSTQQRVVQEVQSIPAVVTSMSSGNVVNLGKGCLVKNLFENRFNTDRWTEAMRIDILKKGRPCPKLEMAHENDQKHVLRTSEFYYRTVSWLTGSSELNKWFCWPCLLFCPHIVWSWDPKTFNRATFISATDRHEITSDHLEAAVRMKTYEMNIKKSVIVPSQYRNEAVCKNRRFFKLLVEVVCTVKKKLNNMYTSHVDCVELLNLISSYDGDLKDYLLNKPVFSKNSPADHVSSYVAGILASVETHLRAKVKSELDAAPFVCLILEDASEVVDNKSWISVIVRFVNQYGDICERFVKFAELGHERNPSAVLPVFKSIVTELDCGEKLVGFTYGGTMVEPPLTSSFNEMISSEYPTARFFHYKEHNLRKLICQALSHLTYTRGFFQCVSDLSDFFECTPNAVKTFVTIDKDVYRDRPSPQVWDFSSGFILTIKNHYESIVKFLMRVIAWPSDWTSEATIQAPYFLNFLRKVQNRFLIVLLSKLFLSVEALTKAMEEKIDVDEWKLLVKRAMVNILHIKRNAFDEIVEIASSNSLTKETASGVLISPEIRSSIYMDTFNDVIDCVATFIRCRNKGAEFSFISLDTVKSISENKEPGSKQQITDRLLANMKIDNFSKLKAQVNFFCNNKFFEHKSFTQTIRCIEEFKLSETLPDLHKFLQFLITVPMISTDTLPKPAVNRVKTYVRGKTELNSVDALMWIEKDLIDKLQEDGQFYDDVIDTFVKHCDEANMN